jgi:hypothetical protein
MQMKNKAIANIDLAKTINFLKDIGITVGYASIDGVSFLPGVSIVSGGIIIDEEKLLYPGDILHEAGHLAVVPPEDRATLNEHDIALRPQREAEEMMTIAWSYAVCVHIGIDARFVFHDDGYKGGGTSLAENFVNKQYFGVPMLQWVGMTLEEKNAVEQGKPYYPAMLHWLRQ